MKKTAFPRFEQLQNEINWLEKKLRYLSENDKDTCEQLIQQKVYELRKLERGSGSDLR